jgi:membrane protease YdiL (CAAX protease family)
VEAESLGVEIRAPPAVQMPVTVGSLWRDAAVDLVGALCVMGLIAIVIVIGVVIAKGARNLNESMLTAWGIASLLLATELPLLYLAVRRRRRNQEKQRTTLGLFDGETGKAIPMGIAAGFGMVTLSALYSLGIQRLFGEHALSNQLEFLENILNDRAGVAVIFVLVAVLAPFCEEIFFRGAIFGSARAAGRSTAGAIISALLFALVHASLLLAPFYATFALVMCWLYARTGTLAAPIAAHMTLNGVACAAVVIAGAGRV